MVMEMDAEDCDDVESPIDSYNHVTSYAPSNQRESGETSSIRGDSGESQSQGWTQPQGESQSQGWIQSQRESQSQGWTQGETASHVYGKPTALPCNK